MVKKIVVADSLAPLVAATHANAWRYSPATLLLGAYGYSIQLYAGFSGITDIALGIGVLFGIRGPENFDLPFFATNIQDYWRRWHMSLPSWLGDYLFLPLRMSLRRLGDSGLALAIAINMMAVGVWHGFRDNFAAFGLINGAFMIVSVFTLKRRNGFFRKRPRLAAVRAWAGRLITSHLVVFPHLFFGAASVHQALSCIARMSGVIRNPVSSPGASAGSRIDPAEFVPPFLWAGFIETVQWGIRRRGWAARFNAAPVSLRWALYYTALAVLFLSYRTTLTFMYAQF